MNPKVVQILIKGASRPIRLTAAEKVAKLAISNNWLPSIWHESYDRETLISIKEKEDFSTYLDCLAIVNSPEITSSDYNSKAQQITTPLQFRQARVAILNAMQTGNQNVGVIDLHSQQAKHDALCALRLTEIMQSKDRDRMPSILSRIIYTMSFMGVLDPVIVKPIATLPNSPVQNGLAIVDLMHEHGAMNWLTNNLNVKTRPNTSCREIILLNAGKIGLFDSTAGQPSWGQANIVQPEKLLDLAKTLHSMLVPKKRSTLSITPSVTAKKTKASILGSSINTPKALKPNGQRRIHTLSLE